MDGKADGGRSDATKNEVRSDSVESWEDSRNGSRREVEWLVGWKKRRAGGK